MLGRLARAASLLLLGWFAFIMGAVVYARVLGRESTTPPPDADEIDLVTTFGELNYVNAARSFRGGQVTTWFGGGTLDLRGAQLDPAGATLRTQTVFGGGNLVVPADWRVETKILPIFGGIGDGRPDGNPPVGGPTLRLEGLALFGGWGISSEAPGEELVTA
jgi:predicted membrane protein